MLTTERAKAAHFPLRKATQTGRFSYSDGLPGHAASGSSHFPYPNFQYIENCCRRFLLGPDPAITCISVLKILVPKYLSSEYSPESQQTCTEL